MTKYEGIFEIWFEGTLFSESRTRIVVQKRTDDYWYVTVPIGDDDAGCNLALRAVLEFIEKHWGLFGVLSTTASVTNNELCITVKRMKGTKSRYVLKYEKVVETKTYPCLSLGITKDDQCYGTMSLIKDRYICDTCGNEYSEWSLEYAKRWRRGDYHDYMKEKK